MIIAESLCTTMTSAQHMPLTQTTKGAILKEQPGKVLAGATVTLDGLGSSSFR